MTYFSIECGTMIYLGHFHKVLRKRAPIMHCFFNVGCLVQVFSQCASVRLNIKGFQLGYFSYWLVTVKRFQLCGRLSTFYVEIFSLWHAKNLED